MQCRTIQPLARPSHYETPPALPRRADFFEASVQGPPPVSDSPAPAMDRRTARLCEAVQVLQQLGDYQHVNKYCLLLIRHANPLLRIQGIENCKNMFRRLGESNEPPGTDTISPLREALRDCLTDVEPAVRAAAALHYLNRCGNAAPGVRELLTVLNEDHHMEVRVAAMVGIEGAKLFRDATATFIANRLSTLSAAEQAAVARAMTEYSEVLYRDDTDNMVPGNWDGQMSALWAYLPRHDTMDID